jgi:membrane fusion protein (multidrug efflux system)
MALNVMQKDGSKGSPRGKFQRAGWNDSYLSSLLRIFLKCDHPGHGRPIDSFGMNRYAIGQNPPKGPTMRRIALALTVLLPAAAFAQPAAQPAAQAVPVGVVAATKQAVTQGVEFVGRIEAIEKVEVRARVSGYLLSVDFTEGGTVKAGAPLFTIDPAPFQAALLQARGALVQAEAQLANAAVQRRRAEELVKTSAVSVATRDERVAQEKSAEGQKIQAEAALQTAAINLSYTVITSPIAGRVGRAAITKGNLITPNTGTLTTIVSRDPMYAVFPVSQREFLRVEHGTQADTRGLLVRVYLADGSVYPEPGRINFVNVTVDRSTDTVLVRATVPNPNGGLEDGQFVRVRVEGDQPADLLVIPQAALVIDQQGAYVFVVDDGRASVRRVKTGPQVGRGIAVEEGLQAGEQVIVDGISLLRPGAPVIAAPAKGL